MNTSEEPCADSRVDCGQFETPAYFLVLMTSLNVVIFLAGLLGNVAVLGVLMKNRGLFETTGVFLLNLAVADLLVILIAQPTALMDLFTQEIWYLGEVMCKSHFLFSRFKPDGSFTFFPLM